jgi:hypothetical protein
MPWHVCFFDNDRSRRHLPRLAFFNSDGAEAGGGLHRQCHEVQAACESRSGAELGLKAGGQG